jgi:hypothetical protein
LKPEHKVHLKSRNTFPKEVFPKSKDFPFDFGVIKNLGFGNEPTKSSNRRCTTGKHDTFLGDFIFLGTEEYNWTIFLSTGIEECFKN